MDDHVNYSGTFSEFLHGYYYNLLNLDFLWRYQKEKYNEETIIKAPDQQVICLICGETVLTSFFPEHLNLHELKKKLAEEKKQKIRVKCPVCCKIILKKYLDEHLNLHKLKRGRKKYECCICSNRFCTLKYLTRD
jgi:ribosomal protein S27E